MDKLKLVFPTERNKEQILDYKKEFKNELDNLHGTAGLRVTESFESWYSDLLANSKEETVKAGLVPSTTYLCIRESDNKLIGFIDCRHRLNNFLTKFGGHIGYSIRSSERRKGYAKQMLALALNKYKEMNIDKVLITCDKNNMGSAKTIMSNGGILENELSKGDKITQRYWVKI